MHNRMTLAKIPFVAQAGLTSPNIDNFQSARNSVTAKDKENSE